MCPSGPVQQVRAAAAGDPAGEHGRRGLLPEVQTTDTAGLQLLHPQGVLPVSHHDRQGDQPGPVSSLQLRLLYILQGSNSTLQPWFIVITNTLVLSATISVIRHY